MGCHNATNLPVTECYGTENDNVIRSYGIFGSNFNMTSSEFNQKEQLPPGTEKLSLEDNQIRTNMKTIFIDLNFLNKENKWNNHIPDNFLLGCQCTNIIIINGDSIESIGNSFLSRCSFLVSFDTSKLSKVLTIGNYFLSDCSNHINLEQFEQTSKIQYIEIFSHLTSINLDGFKLLRSVGNYFLSFRSNLPELDTSKLSNLNKIETNFASHCTKLTLFNTYGFTRLTKIPAHFLYKCTSLKSFDTKNFIKVDQICAYFLCECTNLENVYISKKFRTNSYFITGCTSLENVYISKKFMSYYLYEFKNI